MADFIFNDLKVDFKNTIRGLKRLLERKLKIVVFYSGINVDFYMTFVTLILLNLIYNKQLNFIKYIFLGEFLYQITLIILKVFSKFSI